MFNSLKSRIIVPVVLIMAITVLIVVGALTLIATSVTREAATDLSSAFIDERLDAASEAIKAYLAAYEQQTFIAANAMGSSAELISLINAGVREDIWQYAFNQKNHFGVAEIIISDANGITLARSHMREHVMEGGEIAVAAYGDNVSGVPSIAAGLRGEQLTLYTPTPTAEMVMTTASPIMDGNTIIGAVVVNFVVGSFDFVDHVGENFGVDATVFRVDAETGDAISVASTLIHPTYGTRAVGTAAAREAVTDPVIGRGEHIILELNVFGMLPYIAYYFPLPGADGRPNGMFFVGISQEYAQERTVALVDDLLQSLIAISAVVGLVCVVVSVILLFLIIVNSLKPIDRLTENIKDVASGNFNINISSRFSRDELGRLTLDIYDLVNVIKSMLEDMDEFNREAGVNGDLDYRIDSSKYQGAYKDMLDAVNVYADNSSNDIRATIDVLQKFTEGVKQINIPKMPGKKAELANSLRALEINLETFSAAVMSVSENAAKGNFELSIDASGLRGLWGGMIDGLANFVGSVQRPLNEVRNVLDRVEQGLFDTNVEGDYAGDFLAIKNDLNSVTKTLGTYIAEIDKCLGALSQGDLTYKMNMQMRGDFSRIEASVQAINTSLSNTMRDISSASEQVLSGSRQISSSAMDLASGASVQAESVQELNDSIDKINSQTRQNAENAGEANSLSNKSTQSAQDGNDAMKQMLDAMNQIKESSNNISKIIQVIQDIAFQTNLLALNAAVEAARAGEHGKGFAVVAEEVRSLAARSQTAATETTEMIADSLKRVDVGSGIAGSTAEALDTIVTSANEVLRIIKGISASSSEQAEAIEQVSAGIMKISQVVQSNSAASEETAAAAQELTAQADLLQGLVGYFKM
ncbi:MAG: methyl-accepting chemotaxis protein [Defluviitaleaceae bacterium]|nr:methyl-accepting chemotaxis protein [Defluviitaleaceae bacterium]